MKETIKSIKCLESAVDDHQPYMTIKVNLINGESFEVCSWCGYRTAADIEDEVITDDVVDFIKMCVELEDDYADIMVKIAVEL